MSHDDGAAFYAEANMSTSHEDPIFPDRNEIRERLEALANSRRCRAEAPWE